MNKTGPIIVIEDDLDDQELLTEIFKKLDYKNKVVFYKDGNEALEYLNDTEVQPFLILTIHQCPQSYSLGAMHSCQYSTIFLMVFSSPAMVVGFTKKPWTERA